MAAAMPVRLDFGGTSDATRMSSAAELDGEAVGKEARGRQVLKQVQNMDLNLARAWKAFVPGGKVERDFTQTKEEFSKVKFTYQELSAKNDFIRSVVEGWDGAQDDQEAEEKLAEGKQTVKKSKEKCKALKEEVEAHLADACHKYEQLQSEIEDFKAFVESGNYSDEMQVSSRMAELDSQIRQQQDIIRQQEENIRALSQQRQELSISVRGLDTEVRELSELAHPSAEDLQDRRAAAWFENANSVLCSLCGVSNVEMKDTAVAVEFEATPYAREGLKQHSAVSKKYTLTLEFHHGDERLTGATISPADVEMSDLVSTCVTGGSTQGTAVLLMELKSRLSCRLALMAELEQLKSRFSFTMVEEGGAVILEFSPAIGKNASRWRCEVNVDCDYPREHVVPELASVRNGAFQSPGMKRERALMDSVSRVRHLTVTEMLEDVARRLSN